MDQDTYLAMNVLDTFTETLGIMSYDVDVIVVIGFSVTTPGTGMGMCIAIFMIIPGFKSIEGPCGVFAPG